MKTVIVNLMMAMVLMANVAWASTGVEGDSSSTMQVEIVEHKNQMVAVHYSTVEAGRVKIKITNDDTNQIVYVDTEANYSLAVKKFDLSKLEAGRYLIEVSNGQEVVSKFIQVQ